MPLVDQIRSAIERSGSNQLALSQATGLKRSFVQAVLRGEFPRANKGGRRILASEDARYRTLAVALTEEHLQMSISEFLQQVEQEQTGGEEQLVVQAVEDSFDDVVASLQDRVLALKLFIQVTDAGLHRLTTKAFWDRVAEIERGSHPHPDQQLRQPWSDNLYFAGSEYSGKPQDTVAALRQVAVACFKAQKSLNPAGRRRLASLFIALAEIKPETMQVLIQHPHGET